MTIDFKIEPEELAYLHKLLEIHETLLTRENDALLQMWLADQWDMKLINRMQESLSNKVTFELMHGKKDL